MTENEIVDMYIKYAHAARPHLETSPPLGLIFIIFIVFNIFVIFIIFISSRTN